MKTTIIGPLTQLLTMAQLPPAGPLRDSQLPIIKNAGIRITDGKILEVGEYSAIKRSDDEATTFSKPTVALPGFIDAHTHLCWAGSRSADYALRLEGVTYTEIAKQGGGILDTVRHTRAATKESLLKLLLSRLDQALKGGVTTCEIKSGYGLTVEDELKILEVIHQAQSLQPINLVPTCLAAHVPPPEFPSPEQYLQHIINKLFPILKKQNLSKRIDIFVEEGAFSQEIALPYLQEAKKQGFSIVLHADQFSRGGALLAAQVGAVSADHLEVSEEEDFIAMKRTGTIPIVLPGASLGLGLPFPPARTLLDSGLPLVIASDWNPGSAPMGRLLAEAALLGAAQKLSIAETLAALTVRAARALQLEDRGVVTPQKHADLIFFNTSDYRDILYYQGSLTPSHTMVNGKIIEC